MRNSRIYLLFHIIHIIANVKIDPFCWNLKDLNEGWEWILTISDALEYNIKSFSIPLPFKKTKKKELSFLGLRPLKWVKYSLPILFAVFQQPVSFYHLNDLVIIKQKKENLWGSPSIFVSQACAYFIEWLIIQVCIWNESQLCF